MITHRCLLAVEVVLAGMVLTALAGCGSGSRPTYRAGGKVIFPDGKPLGAGVVEFRPVQAEHAVTARGQIESDGSFQLSTFRPNDGAIEGEHLALVSPAPPERLGRTRIIPLVIDPRFTQFDTSGLKFIVSHDPAKNQFVLQVDRPRR